MLLNRKARAIRERIKEDLGECIRQKHTHLRRKVVPCSRAHGAFRVWGSFFIDLRNFSFRGCLELLSRTARAIAGQLREDLGGCIRQIHTHLRRLSWASFFWSLPIEGSLFLRLSFIYLFLNHHCFYTKDCLILTKQ